MFLTTYCNMAIYCNTLKGNMQYGIDPYCYIPNTYVHQHTCTQTRVLIYVQTHYKHAVDCCTCDMIECLDDMHVI